MVSFFAKRYDGLHMAEYDDLYQEGMIAVIEALQKGRKVAKDIVAKRMMTWVNLCARRGVGQSACDPDTLLGE